MLQHLEILFELHFMIVNNQKIYTCFWKQWFIEKGHMFVSPKVLECYMHIRCTKDMDTKKDVFLSNGNYVK